MLTNVLDYLEKTVQVFSDKIGFLDEKEEITFRDFQNNAKKIAMGIPAEWRRKPVVIFMKKSVRELEAFMGAVYSGNYYVPVDPDSPMERILKILSVVNSEVIICDKEYTGRLQEQLDVKVKIIPYEDCLKNEIDEDYLNEIRNHQLDTDPLYVLFTSGSTGVPKGVIISHKSVIDYTEWLIETFEFSQTTIFGNQAPFYFDNSILDIYSTLKVGAKLCIIPEKAFVFPGKLLEYLKVNKINTIFWVPSALISVANANVLSNQELPDLEKILFCGEVMPNKQLNIWRRNFPDVLFANLYGPTEITDVCACYIVDREFEDDEPLPIGKACKNMQILVLNEKDELCRTDEVGELCVRGTGLSLGYFGNPEKTQTVFVQNPLNDAWSELIYRTGDLVKYNDRNELMYLGRKDFQIKHMGHRIELGEIETAAYSLEGIEQCCALYHDTKKQIVLFCSIVDSFIADSSISDKRIYAWLKNKVPRYMLPSVIRIKEVLPLNDNGKIDRVRLKKEMMEM